MSDGTDAGGDGDWSLQACREEENGLQSWDQDGQVSSVSESGREVGEVKMAAKTRLYTPFPEYYVCSHTFPPTVCCEELLMCQ